MFIGKLLESENHTIAVEMIGTITESLKHVPGSEAESFVSIVPLISLTALPGQFTQENLEAQRDKLTWSRSHCK